jgi:D-alanyl-D-alanine carboxypeptidase (penicillin-binding protein 5/6)
MKNIVVVILGAMFISLIAIAWQINSDFKIDNSNIKKVAGEINILPEPEKSDLVRPPEEINEDSSPNVNANSIILIDVPSSYVIYEKNADSKVPIASTTKIMTAIVILDNYSDKLNDIVTINRQMINVEGSDIKLIPNERISVENLLKGLLIMSGNDTAYALATYFGGLDNFVAEMNKRAEYLGLHDTQFKDPAGLNDDGFSTAKELAILASYAMRNEKFRSIVSTSETIITSETGVVVHDLKTSNRLIKNDESLFYPNAVGIKTGFTYAAGHCLVSAAVKDNHEILGVILNTNDNSPQASARESKKLLEWGFANWTWQ